MQFIREIKYKHVTDSTNNDAKKGHENGDTFGTVYVSNQQTHGRGSHGRTWTSQPGNLYFTLLLNNIFPPFLTLGVGVAVHRTLSKLLPKKTLHIKWPNDVLLEGKKVCGILCESSVTPGVSANPLFVGIGINVAQTRFEGELTETATSLVQHGCTWTPSQVLDGLLKDIDLVLAELLANPTSIITACNQHLAFFGRPMFLDDDQGVVEGINHDGSLLFSGKVYISGTLRTA